MTAHQRSHPGSTAQPSPEIILPIQVIYLIGALFSYLDYCTYNMLPPDQWATLWPSHISFTQEGSNQPYFSFGVCDQALFIAKSLVIQEGHILLDLAQEVPLGHNFQQKHHFQHDEQEGYIFRPPEPIG
jgi:hypothetical protein